MQGVHWDFEGRPGRAWADCEDTAQPARLHRPEARSREDQEGFERCFFTPDRATQRPNADPFGRYIEISPYTLDQIRYWMRQNFNFPNDVPIVIKEVPCVKDEVPADRNRDHGGGEECTAARMFKIQKPINEITFDHVYDLIENPMPCC